MKEASVSLRREPKTLNMMQVCIQSVVPAGEPIVVYQVPFLPDQMQVELLSEFARATFQLTATVLRAAGIRTHERKEESAAALTEIVHGTIKRMQSAVVDSKGRAQIPTLDGRDGVFPFDEAPAASGLVGTDGEPLAAAPVAESATPAKAPPPPERPPSTLRTFQGLEVE